MNILDDVFVVVFRPGTTGLAGQPKLLGTPAGFPPNVRLSRPPSRDARPSWEQFLAALYEREEVELVALLVVEGGNFRLLTSHIVCRLEPFITPAQAQATFAQRGLEVVARLPFAENTWAVRDAGGDPRRTSAHLAALLESGALDAAPDWIDAVRGESFSSVGAAPDSEPPFLNEQWHHRAIETAAAWEISRGARSVRVGVLDAGFDKDHPDLSGQIASGFRVLLGGAVQSGHFDAGPRVHHGTSVAGMVAALPAEPHPPLGVAPDCQLVLVRTPVTESLVELAMAFWAAAEADAAVVNCSLGPRDGVWPPAAIMDEVFQWMTGVQREGAGILCVQAVGDADVAVSLDGVASHEKVLAVNQTKLDVPPELATEMHDTGAMGPELGLCAPGVLLTALRHTAPNEPGYSVNASGTSFAAPLVAGVAALVLSVNPSLSWRQVKAILCDTADKIDAAACPYVDGRNDTYGHGRVNARAAVEAAKASLSWVPPLHIVPLEALLPVPPCDPRLWASPELWVRQSDDDGTTPEAFVLGQPAHLRARVTHGGGPPSPPGRLRFFLSTFAATEVRRSFDFVLDPGEEWTRPLEGRVAFRPRGQLPRSLFPAPGVYLVDEVDVPPLAEGRSAVVRGRLDPRLVPPGAHGLFAVLVPREGPRTETGTLYGDPCVAMRNVLRLVTHPGGKVRVPIAVGHPEAPEGELTLAIARSDAARGLRVVVEAEPAAAEGARTEGEAVARAREVTGSLFESLAGGTAGAFLREGETPLFVLPEGVGLAALSLRGLGRRSELELRITAPIGVAHARFRFEVVQLDAEARVVGGVRVDLMVT